MCHCVQLSEYAESNGAYRSWMLRSHVYFSIRISAVNASGEIVDDTYHYVNDDMPVRPALWIDLSLIK